MLHFQKQGRTTGIQRTTITQKFHDRNGTDCPLIIQLIIYYRKDIHTSLPHNPKGIYKMMFYIQCGKDSGYAHGLQAKIQILRKNDILRNHGLQLIVRIYQWQGTGVSVSHDSECLLSGHLRL